MACSLLTWRFRFASRPDSDSTCFFTLETVLKPFGPRRMNKSLLAPGLIDLTKWRMGSVEKTYHFWNHHPDFSERYWDVEQKKTSCCSGGKMYTNHPPEPTLYAFQRPWSHFCVRFFFLCLVNKVLDHCDFFFHIACFTPYAYFIF